MRCSTISRIAASSTSLMRSIPRPASAKTSSTEIPPIARRSRTMCAARPALPASRSPHSASVWTANGFAREKAKDLVRRCLRSYTNGKVFAINGWFYHFNDASHTATRWKDVEISTSDCIWLLAASLTCRQFFHEDHEIVDLATLLYSRYDFPWMTNGNGKLLSHGWKPEGFLRRATKSTASLPRCICWGSARPPIRCRLTPGTPGSATPTPMASTTTSANRCCGPINIPSRGSTFAAGVRTKAGKIDWWANCEIATRAHREWCYTDLAKEFPRLHPDHLGPDQLVQPDRLQGLGRASCPLQARRVRRSLRCRRLADDYAGHLHPGACTP